MLASGIALIVRLPPAAVVCWTKHRARMRRQGRRPLVARECRTCAMPSLQIGLEDVAEDSPTQTPTQRRMRERMAREDVEELEQQRVEREAVEVLVVRVVEDEDEDEDKGMTMDVDTDEAGEIAGVSAQRLSGETWRVSSDSARWDLHCAQCGGGEDCPC